MIKGFSYRKREVQKCVAYVKQRKGYISYIAFLQLIFLKMEC